MAQLKAGTTIGGNVAFHTGNMGAGSGLDADLLDGKQLTEVIADARAGLSADHSHPYLPLSGGALTGNASIDGNLEFKSGHYNIMEFAPATRNKMYVMKGYENFGIFWQEGTPDRFIAATSGETTNFALDVSSNGIFHLGHKVFHQGFTPTKAEVGLGNVNNWAASSATNDPSTTKYGTTAGVKSAYDLAASKMTQATADGRYIPKNTDVGANSIFWSGNKNHQGLYWGAMHKDADAHNGEWAYIRALGTGQLEIGSDNLINIYETDSRALAIEIQTNTRTLDAKGGLKENGVALSAKYLGLTANAASSSVLKGTRKAASTDLNDISPPDYSMVYDTYESGTANQPHSSGHNANGVITLNTHPGYRAQIAFDAGDGNMHVRSTGMDSTYEPWGTVFTTQNTPTKSHVGLANVNNWSASSATNDASTSKYGTTAGVKSAFDRAVLAENNSKAYSDNLVSQLIGEGAKANLDTIKELGDALDGNSSAIAAINASIATKANTSDLNNYVAKAGSTMTGALRFDGHNGIKMKDGKRVLWSHNNGHVTLSATSNTGHLYLGYNAGNDHQTQKVLLNSNLYTSNAATIIANTSGHVFDSGQRVYSPVNKPTQSALTPRKHASVAAGKWYKIATGNARSSSEFIISDGQSGRHGYVRIHAGISYGNTPNISLIARAKHGGNTGIFRHIRIRRLSGDVTYGTYALEVYVEATGTLYCHQLYDFGPFEHWNLVDISEADAIDEATKPTRVTLDTTKGYMGSTARLVSSGVNVYDEANKPTAADVGAITQSTADGRYLPKALPDHTANASWYFPTWHNGTNTLYTSKSKLMYKPSDGRFKSTTFEAANWFRSTGNSGWYNETHGGGIYMIDTVWVRVYNGKKFHVANTAGDSIYTTGGIRANGNALIGGSLTAGTTTIKGNISITGDPSSTNQAREIRFQPFDKEGTSDNTDYAHIKHTVNTGGHAGTVLEIRSMNDSNDGIAFTTHSSSKLKHNGHEIYTKGNKPTPNDIGAMPDAPITISKTLVIGTDWMDTGIDATDLASGSYCVQISGMTSAGSNTWSEIWTGLMSWHSASTNSANADEIMLHGAGHADNTTEFYLRTLRQTAGSGGVLKLQIASNRTNTSTNVTFKFKKLI